MQYITISKAAKYLQVTPQAVWSLIRRNTLKHIKLVCPTSKREDPILHTSIEWIEEWKAHKYSKELYMSYNGRRLYNSEEGLYSVKQAAEIMGLDKRRVQYLVETGQLKSTKRSYYYVIHKDAIEEYQKNQKQEVKHG